MQFLTFAGLYAFAVMATEDREQRTKNKERGAGEPRTENRLEPGDITWSPGHLVTWSPGHLVTRSTFAALLAGLAFGQVALARVDFVLVVGPPLAYLFYVWLTRRWSRIHTWLAIDLGAMLLHAALHVVFIARAYFFDTLSARLQDYALRALIALPFQPPVLQTYWLSRGNSKIGIQAGPRRNTSGTGSASPPRSRSSCWSAPASGRCGAGASR